MTGGCWKPPISQRLHGYTMAQCFETREAGLVPTVGMLGDSVMTGGALGHGVLIARLRPAAGAPKH
jgi:hypothetical protein